jgi:hypothetical protein
MVEHWFRWLQLLHLISDQEFSPHSDPLTERKSFIFGDGTKTTSKFSSIEVSNRIEVS